MHFEISASSDGAARSWVVRLHLLPNQRLTATSLDGEEQPAQEGSWLVHLAPLSAEDTARQHFPYGGAGARPPVNAVSERASVSSQPPLPVCIYGVAYQGGVCGPARDI